MIVYRVFPFDVSARPDERGGALWWPRGLQGSGRHDNPDRYACIYASEAELSPVVEVLAPFRSSGPLIADMLVRGGLPTALAALELDDEAGVIDLDDPRVLVAEELRPSRVATRDRGLTQVQAAELFDDHPGACGLRWWSTLESLWANLTIFDRAGQWLTIADARTLSPSDPVVAEAAEFLGLARP